MIRFYNSDTENNVFDFPSRYYNAKYHMQLLNDKYLDKDNFRVIYNPHDLIAIHINEKFCVSDKNIFEKVFPYKIKNIIIYNYICMDTDKINHCINNFSVGRNVFGVDFTGLENFNKIVKKLELAKSKNLAIEDIAMIDCLLENKPFNQLIQVYNHINNCKFKKTEYLEEFSDIFKKFKS